MEEVSVQERALRILQEKTKFCFEGGGVLGMAYAGCLIRLRELGGLSQSITHCVGSSVGSIASIALSCGATPEYIKGKIIGMDLLRFKDGGGPIRRAFRLIFRYGSYKGDEVERFIGEILNDLTGNSDITFLEAYQRFGTVLTITYLSARHKKTKYANHLLTPTMQIKVAARWSSTIPLFFQASRKYTLHSCLFKKSAQRQVLEDLIVDGGVTDNFPLHVLREQGCDPSKVLGFKLFNTGQNRHDQPDVEDVDYGLPKNVVDYVFRLVEIIREQALRYHVQDEDWKLTCKINVGNIKTTDFQISAQDKQWLYESGVKAIDDHLLEIADLLQRNEYP